VLRFPPSLRFGGQRRFRLIIALLFSLYLPEHGPRFKVQDFFKELNLNLSLNLSPSI